MAVNANGSTHDSTQLNRVCCICFFRVSFAFKLFGADLSLLLFLLLSYSNGSIRVTYRIKIQPGSPEGYKKSDKLEEKLLEHFVKKIGETGPWRRIRWDPNFFRRFLKVEMTTVAPSTTTTMEPTKETTKPAKETTKLMKETTKPMKETTQPAKETIDPKKETTKPSKETTEPTEETIKPTKETTKPMKETTHPAKETTKPTKETTRPAKETTEPTEETTKPTKEATKATEETTEISTSKTKATIQTEFYESTAKALGETFTENLTDPNSEEFRAMEEKFCKAVSSYSKEIFTYHHSLRSLQSRTEIRNKISFVMI